MDRGREGGRDIAKDGERGREGQSIRITNLQLCV